MAIGRVNTGGGGSGGTLTVAGIVGHTVTATKDGKTYTRTFNSSGVAVFKGLSTGTWTLTMTGDGQTATRTVDVNADYAVTITYFSATINITYPANSNCVVTNSGGQTVASDTNTGSSAKTWTATVGATGTYTITATSTSDSSKTKSTTVDITADGQSESVELDYFTYYYNKGDTCDSVTGGWVKTGTGGSLNFNSASMTLVVNSLQNATNAATTNKVDLTNIKTLYFSVKSATTYPIPGYPRIGIATINNPKANTTSGWTATNTLSSSSSFRTVSIDVSSCTGSYYIIFGGVNGDDGGTTIEVESVWGDYK